jgi:hypothetical protein
VLYRISDVGDITKQLLFDLDTLKFYILIYQGILNISREILQLYLLLSQNNYSSKDTNFRIAIVDEIHRVLFDSHITYTKILDTFLSIYFNYIFYSVIKKLEDNEVLGLMNGEPNNYIHIPPITISSYRLNIKYRFIPPCRLEIIHTFDYPPLAQ